jgi:hypothetical protein
MIQACSSANIISKTVHNILAEKLERRNSAAHPSGTVTSQPTAEEFIEDLVENVVLKLISAVEANFRRVIGQRLSWYSRF